MTDLQQKKSELAILLKAYWEKVPLEKLQKVCATTELTAEIDALEEQIKLLMKETKPRGRKRKE